MIVATSMRSYLSQLFKMYVFVYIIVGYLLGMKYVIIKKSLKLKLLKLFDKCLFDY